MPMAAAGAAAGVGMIGQGIMQSKTAGAAEEASLAQRQAAMAATAPTTGELAAMQRQTEVTERAIMRQEALLNAVDPALMEAGKQALALLQGKEAAVLTPLRQAQARQTAQTQARLQEQLGGGFATSSAGIEAMTRLQESQLMQQAQAQQQTLGGLLGVSAQARPSVEGLVGGIAGAPVSAYQNIAQRQLQAVLGSPLQPAGVGQAQAFGDIFGTIGRVGTTLGTYGLAQNMGLFEKYETRSPT